MTKPLSIQKRRLMNFNGAKIKLLPLTVILTFLSITAISQIRIKAGSINDLKASLTLSSGANGKSSNIRTIPITNGEIDAVINSIKSEKGIDVIIGKLEEDKGSNVYFKFSGNTVEGSIVLPETEKAYSYHSDASGNVFVSEVDIHAVLCVNLDEPENAGSSSTNPVALSVPPNTSPVYQLQSLPGVPFVVMLDFDGQYVSGSRWNGGNPIDAQAGNFTETDITNIWKMVSEDYRPFNLNITTSEAIFQAAPKGRRMRCIFTPTNTAAPGSGGVAYVNSFTWTDDTPCWVFNSGVKGAGEAGSHEVGHTMGLSHDGRNLSTGKEEYYQGQGNWAPIMGASYYKNITQWSKGEYQYANNTQDDVAIIGSTKNGFGFKKDEDANSTSSAKALAISTTGAIQSSNYGIITTNTDQDYYSFNTSGGSVTITVNPSASYPDLDVILKLLNASGSVVVTADPTNTQAATITSTLASGQYYLVIDGTGQGDPFTTGYSDYASIGEYTISGTIPVSSGNQSPVVTITSPANNATYNAPASFTFTANASDTDGSIVSVEFFNGTQSIGVDNASPYSGSISNLPVGTYTLSAKATDNLGASSTASVTIKVINPTNTPPSVSITSPANAASFNAPASFTISANATDVDGTVATVQFLNGSQSISIDNAAPYSAVVSNLPAGTYTLTATATDNAGATSSTSITITVKSTTNSLPTVAITSPTNNASFNAPATVTITATAADQDGTISSVEFLLGSQSILIDNSAPYSASLTNLAAGSYSISAKATDNLGGTATASIVIVVNTVTNDNCANISQYVEAGGYVAGSIVKNGGNKYQCKPWPYSGWCNGGSMAYAPGTGWAWSDAWTLLGSCTSSSLAISSANSIATPHPFNTHTTIAIENGEKIHCIKIYNTNGKEIFNSGKINRESLSVGEDLEAGYYILHIETESGISIKNLVKTQ